MSFLDSAAAEFAGENYGSSKINPKTVAMQMRGQIGKVIGMDDFIEITYIWRNAERTAAEKYHVKVPLVEIGQTVGAKHIQMVYEALIEEEKRKHCLI